jgi:hypothetical protein
MTADVDDSEALSILDITFCAAPVIADVEDSVALSIRDITSCAAASRVAVGLGSSDGVPWPR